MATPGLSSEEFTKKYSTQALDDDYEVCRAKVDWKKLESDEVKESDVARIKMLAGSEDEMFAPDDDIDAIWADTADALATARALVNVLRTREHSKTYILTLLSHILTSEPERAAIFLKLGLSARDLVKVFSRIWIREDLNNFTRGKAAICGAAILRWFDIEAAVDRESSVSSEDSKSSDSSSVEAGVFSRTEVLDAFKSLTAWLMSAMRRLTGDELESPLYALKLALKNPTFQQVYLADDQIEGLFVVLDRHAAHRQVTYLAVYSLWILSFNSEAYATPELLLDGSLIDRLVKIIVSKSSNKVTRVILATFENLLGCGNFNETLVLFRFHATLEAMLEDKIEDGEQKASASKILEELSHSVKVLSSMERYESEVSAKKLLWGPCHTELFWKKYSRYFEEDDFKLLRKLLDLLSSHDPETKAIACFDIGEWSRYYPDGNKVIAALGGKLRLMLLIEDPDPVVRREAISALQKILIKNWQALGAVTTSDD